MIEFQCLDWDSNQLGFSVAKISASRATSQDCQTALAALKAQGTQLVYWCSDRGDESSEHAARECQGILVDEKTRYRMCLSSCVAMPSNVWRYSDEVLSPELISLAHQVGLKSRFHLDPNMPRDAHEKIYSAWIKNSVNRLVADDMFVTKNKDKITGFITLVKKEGHGTIALIAVDDHYRGQGLATALLTAAKHWCAEQQYSYCEVVTQKTNVAACRLYEKNGFTVDKVENFYHFWLNK